MMRREQHPVAVPREGAGCLGEGENGVPAVVYSIGAALDGGGIGSVAAQAVQGLVSRGCLQRLLVLDGQGGPAQGQLVRFPSWLVTNRIARHVIPDRARDRMYDGWAARHVGRCDVFYGWAHHSLRSLGVARRQGAMTILDRGGVEAGAQRTLLEEECRLMGLPRGPMHPAEVRRAQAEYAATDIIAVPSQFVRDSFLAAGYPEHKLFLNPLGVDAGRFTPAEPPPDAFRVVFLGRVSLQKGILYLLQAWAKLRLTNAELLIVGPVEPVVRPLVLEAIRRATPGSVRLCGPSTQPERVLRQASVLVLPSVQDGFGLVVLEAMAAGLPVIVSDHVGAKDCVREGVDGFVVPMRDADAIAERLAWLAADRGRGQQMGRKARRQALECSWDAYRARLMGKVESLCGARGDGREVARCGQMNLAVQGSSRGHAAGETLSSRGDAVDE